MALPSIFQSEGPGFVEAAEAFDRIDPTVDQVEYIELLERTRVAARVGLGAEIEIPVAK